MRSIKNVWVEIDSDLQQSILNNDCGQNVVSSTSVLTRINFRADITVDSLKDVDYIATKLVEEIRLMITNTN